MRPTNVENAVIVLELRRLGFEALEQRKRKKPQRSCGPPWTQQLSPSPIRYSRSGSPTGSDFSITACMSVKMAVLPPMPSASVSTAVAVKTRAERSVRRA